MSDSEFEDYIDEQTHAPACGSCLVLAEYLRADAATIYQVLNARVHPPKPVDAWRALTDTRWTSKIDLQEFLTDPELDGQLLYERITVGIAPHRLQEWVEREEADIAESIEWMRRTRAQALVDDAETAPESSD